MKSLTNFVNWGQRYIPKLHLRQSGITCSTCRPFTKHREMIENSKNQMI